MLMRRLPILPVKDLVVFPYIYMPISVGRPFSKKAVSEAIASHDSEIIVVLQKDPLEVSPKKDDDFYDKAVVCKIVNFEPMDKTKTTHKLLVQGMTRVSLTKVLSKSGVLMGDYSPIDNVTFDLNKKTNNTLYEAFTKDLLHIIEKGFISEALIPSEELRNPIATCYLLLALSQQATECQALMGIDEGIIIVKEAYEEVLKQKKFIGMKDGIIDQAKESMTQNQKEYFLKEQMKAIRKELGEDEENDVEKYTTKFEEVQEHLNESAKEEILKNIKKLKNAVSESYEVTVTRNYLDSVFELPWGKSSEQVIDIVESKELLNDQHCHLDEVKERILEFLSILKLNPNSNAPIVCFVGPPGVGKTSFAQSIAQAIGRESTRISLGGVKDESEIRGHRKTYVGAMPGKIIQGMRTCGVMNPVFILDEIDKMSSDFKGDPSSAMLEVLDPEQNCTFKDHYMNIDFDLSKVLFVCTANSLDSIPHALRDRLEIIPISGYCEEEKIDITKKYIIPKRLKSAGLSSKDVYISKNLLKNIIRDYSKEYGVRELERQIGKICRKVAKKKAEGKFEKSIKLTKENLHTYLGVPIFSSIEDNKNGVGVVTGLAWTPVGGELLKLEVIALEEKGETILTGRLGEVMQESAKIGVSIIKNNASKFDVPADFFEHKRLHIHAPAGAVPKDGPSAGVALVSCIVSRMTGRKIKDSIAMTGEVTLSGKVLPVGGIREKVLAAIRSNIKKVLIPIDNRKDFEDIPEFLTKKIEVTYLSHVTDAIEEIF